MAGTANAAVTAGIPASSNVLHPGGPIVTASGSGSTTVSLNWSGYAVTSKKLFTYVHTTFVQPAITCTGVADQWTSNWSGLDGYNSDSVEQDGTFAHCGGTGNMTPKYEAWYEMYPANSVSVFAVHPGDIIDSSVSYDTSNGNFTLTISDLSTGKSSGTTATCSTCERTSAEWIVERPELCNNKGTKCFLTELADFGTTTMSGDEAQLTGGAVKGVNGFNNIPIDMVDPVTGGGFISLDTVGAISAKSFTATWDRSGNIFPLS
ncbi:MAG: G1 family glutamic endopeptidase [Streptosporangiaceae bacterium]